MVVVVGGCGWCTVAGLKCRDLAERDCAWQPVRRHETWFYNWRAGFFQQPEWAGKQISLQSSQLSIQPSQHLDFSLWHPEQRSQSHQLTFWPTESWEWGLSCWVSSDLSHSNRKGTQELTAEKREAWRTFGYTMEQWSKTFHQTKAWVTDFLRCCVSISLLLQLLFT